MLAADGHVTSLEDYIWDERWVMEQKLDGHRLMLMAVAHQAEIGVPPAVVTRGGTPYTKRLPAAISAVRFPAGEWILDGELVDGTYWVFDIVAAVGQDLTGLSQETRRIALEQALRTFRHPFKLVPQATSINDKIALAERSLDENFEGLVLKRVDAKYRYGARSHLWLKVKYTHTADVVAMAVRDDGKASVKLGVYSDGDLVEIGRASLLGKEKVHAITPGTVVEVKYLNVGNAGRLVQPTILRVRDDKAPQDCTTAQLRAVNKAVLESL
jgi:ATP-dependent DNA ligase